MEDGVWRQMVEIQPIIVEDPMHKGVQREPHTSDEVGNENDPLPRLGVGARWSFSDGRVATLAGMYPTLRSSRMVPSMTMEPARCPFKVASAMAGKGSFGHERGEWIEDWIWALELRRQ